jgi:hypothetical protein
MPRSWWRKTGSSSRKRVGIDADRYRSQKPLMKNLTIKRVVLIIGGVAGIIVIGWIISWLANGGWPSSGPTGDVLPPHILRVMPADGEIVTDFQSFCVDFSFQEGNGLGHRPERTIRYFLDGINVTNKLHGLVTLDSPPSGGIYCYKSDTPLPPGWHTAKVTYADSTNQKFGYTWRFQVKKEQNDTYSVTNTL